MSHRRGRVLGPQMGSREAWGPWASSNKPAHPAAGEDARIRLWRVPPKGLQEVLTMPEAVLTGEGGLGGLQLPLAYSPDSGLD